MTPTPTQRRITRRRARVRSLAEQGLGVREIARQLKVDPATVSRDLRTEAPDNNGAPPPAPAGHDRSVRHGAFSEQILAPIQARYEETARERWPWLEPHNIAVWARQAARVDQLAGFERERGALHDRADGKVFDVSDRLSKWESSLSKMTLRFDEEAARRNGSSDRGDPGARLILDADLAEQARDLLRRAAARGDGAEPDLATVLADDDLSAAARDLADEAIRRNGGAAGPADRRGPRAGAGEAPALTAPQIAGELEAAPGWKS